MECFDRRGNGICQSCQTVGPGHEVRKLGIEFLRVLGWRYGAGVTIGGEPYEDLLCPACVKTEHKKVCTPATLDNEELPLDWGQYHVTPKTQGGHTR